MAMLAEFDIAHIPETKEGTPMNESATLEQVGQIRKHAEAMFDDPSLIASYLPDDLTREEAGRILRVQNLIRDGQQRPDTIEDGELYDGMVTMAGTPPALAQRECSHCHKIKDPSEFPAKGNQCRQCRSDYNKAYNERRTATAKATKVAVAELVVAETPTGSLDLFINPSLSNLKKIAQLTDGDLNEAARLCDDIGGLFPHDH